MRERGTKTTMVFLPADGEASLVATFKGILMIRQHNAIRKHLILYPQGDRSSLRKPKKGKHQQ